MISSTTDTNSPYPQSLGFSAITDEAIRLACREDHVDMDVTSLATIPADLVGRAAFLVKEPRGVVVCGQPLIQRLFELQGSELQYSTEHPDGTALQQGERFGAMTGPVRSILKLERTALNLLQRASGIASYTRLYTELIQHTGVRVVDTRKTDPCLREICKYSVRIGGGVNHREALHDMFLIKNNHVDALAGDVARAIRSCREYAATHKLFIPLEVEVRDRAELIAALTESPDIILLDNFTPETISEAVEYVRAHALGKKVYLEASGGINEETVSRFAGTGIDFVSVGALTHSYPRVDLALRIEPPK